MNVSPLAIGLAALVVLVVFGPKRLPSFRGKQSNQIDLTSMMPSQPAAGRAPSPLAQSLAPPATPAPTAVPQQPQYAMSGTPAAQQQQPQSPQPLRLPDNL